MVEDERETALGRVFIEGLSEDAVCELGPEGRRACGSLGLVLLQDPKAKCSWSIMSERERSRKEPDCWALEALPWQEV